MGPSLPLERRPLFYFDHHPLEPEGGSTHPLPRHSQERHRRRLPGRGSPGPVSLAREPRRSRDRGLARSAAPVHRLVPRPGFRTAGPESQDHRTHRLPARECAVRAGREVVPDPQHRPSGSVGPLRERPARRRGPRAHRSQPALRGRDRSPHPPVGQPRRVARCLRRERGRIRLAELARPGHRYRRRPARRGPLVEVLRRGVAPRPVRLLLLRPATAVRPFMATRTGLTERGHSRGHTGAERGAARDPPLVSGVLPGPPTRSTVRRRGPRTARSFSD